MSLSIPPLPAAWPYLPRPGLPACGARSGVDLASLGGGWTLSTPLDLQIPASPVPLAGAFGRGGVQRRGDLVLRPYRRGGLVRFLVQSSYASPRRFEREWLVHRALWEAGFPTVRPLGYGFRRRGLAFEGVFLTAFQEGTPWPSSWPTGQGRLPDLAEALKALAGWGLWAPDLNATNVLWAGDRLAVLGWDRSAFLAGADLLPLYQRRLLRSLAKLGAPEATAQAFQDAMKG